MKILNICKSLFDYLNSSSIRYCHWKSNSHLDKALNGETDLDILIHPEDKTIFEQVCDKFAIIKIVSPPEKQFRGLEDYLGFDYETGRFIHLHVHYRLVLGQKYIKNHHLPIENIIFKHLTFEKDVAVPIPELELILLIIRAHMKLDYNSLLKHGIRDLQRKYYCPFPKEIEEEMIALIKACNMEKFRVILAECKLPLSEELFKNFIQNFSSKNLRCYNVFMRKREILAALKDYRRQTGYVVHLKYFCQFILNSRVVKLFLKKKKKTVFGKGKIFSLVGADGSGKSTVIKELDTWLSWKLEVNRYYYGIPKNLFIGFIEYSVRVAQKLHLNYLSSLIDSCLWVFIARERYKIFLLSMKNINCGNLVLTDRFPLIEFRNMVSPMDGPRLNRPSTKVGRYLSQIEVNYYNKIRHPDCAFVLQVNIDELRQRKTDLDISTHRVKADAVNSIRGDGHLITIDAGRPYEDVVLSLKRKIGQCFCTGRCQDNRHKQGRYEC